MMIRRGGVVGLFLFSTLFFYAHELEAGAANTDTTKLPKALFGKRTYKLSIQAKNGTVTRIPKQRRYRAGSQVLLTAVPEPGYEFKYWSRDVISTSNPVRLMMNTDMKISAHFQITNSAPQVEAGLNRSVVLPSALTLRAKASDDDRPDGYLSFAWSMVTGPGRVTFSQPSALETEAIFSEPGNYILRMTAFDGALSSNDELTVVVSGLPVDDILVYSEAMVGSSLASESEPARSTASTTEAVLSNKSGFRTQFFSEPVVGTSVDAEASFSSGVVMVQSAKPLAILSSSHAHKVTLSTLHGTVTMDPDQNVYQTGSRLELTAKPDAGYEFDFWDGDVSGTINPIVVTVDHDLSVLASFKAVNQAPKVDVGVDQVIGWSESLMLNGRVSDDGLPSGTLSSVWTPVSGPAEVSVTDPGALMTAVSFPARGAYTFRLTASDGELSTTDELQVTVNDPPVFSEIGSQSVAEGEMLEVPLNAVDADGDELIFFAESHPEGAEVDSKAKLFRWKPGFDQAGDHRIVFIVSDGVTDPVAQEATVRVFNTNRSPVAGAGQDQTTAGGVTVTLNGSSSSDPDGDPLVYVWSQISGPMVTLFNSSTIQPTFRAPVVGDPQVLRFQLEAIDEGYLSSYDTIDVTVFNSAPVFDPMERQTLSEGQTLTLAVKASDADDDPLTFTAQGLPSGADFDAMAGRFEWTPSYDQAGTYKITLWVSDSFHEPLVQTLQIEVTNVNRPPVIVSGLSFSTDEDQTRSMVLEGSDPDGDALSYEIVTIPSHGTLTENSLDPSQFVYTPQANFNGQDAFAFKAKDAQGLGSDAATATIEVTPVNDAPVFEPIGDKAVVADSALSFSLSATDADGDSLIFSTQNLPAGASLDSNTHTFYWKPGLDQVGDYQITFTVWDRVADPVMQTLGVRVLKANQAPVADAGQDQATTSQVSVSLDGSGSHDPDGEDLLYAWRQSAGPQVTLLNSTKAQCTFTAPIVGNSQALRFALKVTDPSGSTADDTVDVTVSNSAPIFDPPNPQTVAEGQALSLALKVSDVENDALVFSAQGLPSGATLDSTTGLFYWKPSYEHAGTYTVSLSVSDRFNAPVSQDLHIEVKDTNQAPVAHPGLTRSTAEDEVLLVMLEASDPDGDALSYEIVTNPSYGRLTVDSDPAKRVYTPQANYNGNDTFTFKVKDSKQLDSNIATVALRIAPVNDAPVLTPIGNQTVASGATLAFSVSANDVDNDTLAFSAQGLPQGAAFNPTSKTFSWTPDFNQAGEHQIVFSVWDRVMDPVTEAVGVSVLQVNQEPVVDAGKDQVVTLPSSVTLTGTATDDGLPSNTLTVTWSQLSGPGTVNFANANALSTTASFSEKGIYLLRMTVSDGALSSSDEASVEAVQPLQSFTLTVSAPNGSVSKTPDQASYSQGSSVTLTAIPNTGYQFSSWSGSVSGTTNPVTVTMDANKTITANFSQKVISDPPPQTWTPPIGIPRPPFGIEESYRMYDDPAKRNPALTYTQNSEGGFYTHYVDNSVACTDTSNTYGTATKPRCSFVTAMPEGSVVEVHGGPYATSSQLIMTFSCAEAKPCWFRGPSLNQKSIIRRETIVKGSYAILENLHYDNVTNSRVAFRAHNLSSLHHAAVRHSELAKVDIYGHSASVFNNIVVYNNNIHLNNFTNLGPDSPEFPENDTHGVLTGGYSQYVWVVDNDIHDVAGDAVGNAHDAKYTAKDYYIGRNKLHDTGENAVDFKEIENVVISQNKMYNNYGPSSGSDGTALVLHYGPTYSPKNAWVIFNEIYDSSSNGIQIGGSVTDPIYVLGNSVHDIKNAIGTGRAFISWGSRDLHLVGNSFCGNDSGIDITGNGTNAKLYLHNNIIGNNVNSLALHLGLDDSSYRNVADLKNNLFYQNGGQAKFGWGSVINLSQLKALGKCTTCLEGDPLFVNSQINDFHLQASSPAIDKGLASTLYDQYSVFYGPSIAMDFSGTSRPQGPAWDVGAFEYGSGDPREPGTFTLSVSGTNGSVTKSPDLPSYDLGAQVTLIAVPDADYEFSSWSGDLVGSENSATVKLDRNLNVSARFVKKNNAPLVNAGTDQVVTLPSSVTLTGTATDDGLPSNTLTVTWSQLSGPGTVNFANANALSTTASFSEKGIYLLRMTVSDGALSSSDEASVEAVQPLQSFTLTVSAPNGSVSKTPDQASYSQGSSVTLTAIPNTGYQFSSWSGSVSGTTNPVTVTMDTNKSVTANFTIDSPLDTQAPTVSIISPASGTTYIAAQTVTINASATDNIGVTKVEFFNGATLVGTDVTAPFNHPWSFAFADNGTHNWTAKAYDAAGNNATSSITSLIVNISASKEVPIYPGDSVQEKVDANPAGTTFIIKAGTHRGQQVTIPSKSDLKFIGEVGAILDGNGKEYAFSGKSGQDTGDRILIKNLEIKNYAPLIQAGVIRGGGQAWYWTLEDLNIHDNANVGVVASAGWQVRRCHIHHQGTLGVAGSGLNILYEDNEVDNNNTSWADPAWEGGGSKWVWCENLVVRNNKVHDNNGPGLWTDGNIKGILIEGNTVYNNYASGIFIEISHDAIVRNNDVRNNGFGETSWIDGAGILVADSPNAEVYGNTVVGNNDGIAGKHMDRGSGQYGEYALKNLNVHDNIIVITSGQSGIACGSSSNCPLVYSPEWNNRFDYNTYTLPSADGKYYWWGGPVDTIFWKEKGQDVHSTWITGSPQSFTLTVSATNGSVSKSLEGPYNPGTPVTLTAIPDNGYVFSSWSGDLESVESPATVTLNRNLNITARFDKKNQAPVVNAGTDRVVTLPSSATLTGIVTDDGLPSNTLTVSWSKVSGIGTVTFANANALSTPASFSEKGIYVLRLTASDGTLYSTDDVSVEMVQPLQSFILTVSATNGSVTKTPDQSSYSQGSSVTLTAAPNTGYQFSSWSGSVSGSTNPITVTMDANKSVTANFNQKVILNSPSQFLGVPDPGGRVPAAIMPTLPSPTDTIQAFPYDPINMPTPTYTGAANQYWVDSSRSACSDAGKGTPLAPRCSLPGVSGLSWTLAAGSQVFIAGDKISYGGAQSINTMKFTGTASQPIWIIGVVKSPSTPRWINQPKINFERMNVGVTGSLTHTFFHNVHFYSATDKFRWGVDKGDSSSTGSAGYITVRHSTCSGSGTAGGPGTIGTQSVRCFSAVGRAGNEVKFIMLYDNDFFGMGRWVDDFTSDIDLQGVQIQRATYYTWILANRIYHMQGDSVMCSNSNQFNSNPALRPHYLYIAGNEFYENYENAYDSKGCYHVVVSENYIHDFYNAAKPANGSAIIGAQDAESYIGNHYEWILNNKLENVGDAFSYKGTAADAFVYYMGNLAVNINQGAAVPIEARCHSLNNGTYWSCGDGMYFAQNTIDCGQKVSAVTATRNGKTDTNLVPAEEQSQEISFVGNIFLGCLDNSNGSPYKFESINDNWIVTHNYNVDYRALGAPIFYQRAPLMDVVVKNLTNVDPKIVNPTNTLLGDYSLRTDSPALKKVPEPQPYTLFKNLYGLDIRKDLKGKTWQEGADLNVGAYQ